MNQKEKEVPGCFYQLLIVGGLSALFSPDPSSGWWAAGIICFLFVAFMDTEEMDESEFGIAILCVAAIGVVILFAKGAVAILPVVLVTGGYASGKLLFRNTVSALATAVIGFCVSMLI